MVAATSHDEEFDQFFGDGFERCVAVARRITHDGEASKDLAAEAFARAWARWPRLASQATRQGWVLKVTANLAIDATRRKAVKPEGSRDTEAEDAVATRLALAAALWSLPRRQRQAIVLRYLADLSEPAAAMALGVSPGSVKTHVHRGLLRLREMLQEPDDSTIEDRLARQP
jgi:RNA polymerase sigma-70 factor (ECF subfamily)